VEFQHSKAGGVLCTLAFLVVSLSIGIEKFNIGARGQLPLTLLFALCRVCTGRLSQH